MPKFEVTLPDFIDVRAGTKKFGAEQIMTAKVSTKDWTAETIERLVVAQCDRIGAEVMSGIKEADKLAERFTSEVIEGRIQGLGTGGSRLSDEERFIRASIDNYWKSDEGRKNLASIMAKHSIDRDAAKALAKDALYAHYAAEYARRKGPKLEV